MWGGVVGGVVTQVGAGSSCSSWATTGKPRSLSEPPVSSSVK